MLRKTKFLVVIISLLSFSVVSSAQNIKAYNANELMTRLRSNNDTFYIVNFWATWCGPCIKELPEFDKFASRYNGKNVKVLLVSLDFKNEYQHKVAKFIKKKKLQHEVVWLNETKANEFIPKINDNWQGSIPATMLFFAKTQYQSFYEGMIEANKITPLIDKQLKQLY